MKVIRKVLEYLFILIIILSLNFLIPRLMPGDPFTYLSSDEGDIHQSYSEEQINMYKAYYGLDKPLKEQYKDYMYKLINKDLGMSIHYNDKVSNIIKNRAKWTISISMVSLFISFFIGLVLGSISAYKKNSLFDKIIYTLMMILSEIPSFLIGIFLLFTLGAKYKIFPLSGGMTVFSDYTGYERYKDLIMHAAMPIISLVLSQVGSFYLLSRNSMLNIIKKEYIKTAKAKGLETRQIIFTHALRNAIIPIITRLFMSLGSILSSAILVENVFNYPGIGSLMKQSIILRDYTLIQGIFLYVSILVLSMNFLADILYKYIDPRLRYD